MGFFDFFKSPPPKRDESLFLELCASGTAEQVEEAIRNGASVYARYPMWDYKLGYPSTEQFGKQLFTPLLMAAKYNRNDGVLEVLIRHGAEVDAKDYHEWTPLLWASWWTVCFGVHPSQVRALAPEDNPLPQIRKRVKILLDAGANVNARDNVGQTALMYAAKAFNGGDAELVSILIDAGGDVNAKNNLGYTALMYAAAYTVENGIFEPVAEPLIRAGADVNARDNEGQTALTKALELGCNRELIATLKKFGAE